MKYYILILSILVFFSCKKQNPTSYGKKKAKTNVHPGKKLMETKCYVCHNPKGSHDDRIAPPMIAVKKHYINNTTTKDEFITSMQNWIKNPTKENAKMKGAVKKFGVMPKQYFSEKTIQQISEYMFDNEIETPKWFKKHYNEEHGKNKESEINNNVEKSEQSNNLENLSYSERGLKYALSTKAVLGKNLMGKIQKEGTISALKFCNSKAYPLTDSMAVLHKATIKRVSDKPRNQNNKANKKELEYIAIFKNDVLNDKDSEPIVVENSERVNVYYPIKTNGMCLQCHGNKNTQIAPKTMASILDLYPLDKAVGYNINQVRGIWSVSFNK